MAGRDDDVVIARVKRALTHVRAHQDAYAQAKAQFSEQLAPDFSLFQFLRCDELGLSRLIGWLLDPRGTHGQGARFLREYLERSGVGWAAGEDCELVEVRLEARTDRIEAGARRIDILVTAPRWAIAIENKPFATDQPGQLADYFRQLDRLGRTRHAIIYLSDDRRPPSDGSLASAMQAEKAQRGELVLQAWGDLVGWLDACRNNCRADRVRNLIEDFKDHVQRKFVGGQSMDEVRRLAAEIAKSEELILAAHQVNAAFDELRRRLLAKLVSDLRAAASVKGWTFAEDLSTQTQWGGVQFRFSPNDPFAFRVEVGTAQFGEVFFGIRAAEREAYAGTGERVLKIQSALRHVAEPPKPPAGERWVWLMPATHDDQLLPLPRDWGASAAIWADMANGTVANTIVEAAAKVRALLEKGGALLPAVSQPATVGLV